MSIGEREAGRGGRAGDRMGPELRDGSESGYDAFISYSHAVGGQLVVRVQATLQTLAKPWYRRRALRVFRDTTSLSANPELWRAIEDALGKSRFLILMLSPEAAQSPWVGREVAWWKTHRGAASSLLVLTAGTLDWNNELGDFSEDSVVPAGLRGWFEREPLWVDLRWATKEEHVSARDPRFRDCVADLAAPIRRLPKDELIGEDIRQHRRAMRTARGAGALLVALTITAVIGAVIAIHQRDVARNRTELATARQLAATAVSDIPLRLDVAERLAAEAYRRRPNAGTEAALMRTVTASPHFVRALDNGSTITGLTPVTASSVVTGGADGAVRQCGAASGHCVVIGGVEGRVTHVVADRSGRYAAASGSGRDLVVVDLESPHRLTRIRAPAQVQDLAIGPGGMLAVASGDPSGVSLYRLPTGTRIASRDPGELVPEVLSFTDSGNELLLGTNMGQFRWLRVPTLDPVGAWSPPVGGAHGYLQVYSDDRKYFGMAGTAGVLVASTTGRPHRVDYPFASRAFPTALAIAPQASRVAIATNREIDVLEPTTKARDPVTALAQGFVNASHTGGLVDQPLTGFSSTSSLAFVDQRQLVSSYGHVLVLWNLDRSSQIAQSSRFALPDRINTPVPPSLAISPAGRQAAFVSQGDQLGKYDLVVVASKSLRTQFRMTGMPSSGGLAFSRSGRFLAAGGVVGIGGTGGVMLIDLTSGQMSTLADPAGGAYSSAIHRLEPSSGADDLLAFRGNGDVDRLAAHPWRLTPLVRIPSAPVPTGGFENGLTAVAASRRTQTAFEVVNQNLYRLDLAGHPRAQLFGALGLTRYAGAALTPDGRLLAASDGQHSVALWDTASRQVVRRVDVGDAVELALSPDGRQLVTLTAAGLMTAWDVSSGAKLGDVTITNPNGFGANQAGEQTSMGFAEDGKLWTATSGGGVNRWAMTPAGWLASICSTIPGRFSGAEWHAFSDLRGAPTFSCS
jgi:WD40 repeat protein